MAVGLVVMVKASVYEKGRSFVMITLVARHLQGEDRVKMWS